MGGEEEGRIDEPVSYHLGDSSPERPEQEDCPACRGKGTYALLITVRPCEACGGTGKIAAKAAEVAGDPGFEAGPWTWVATYTYDKDGELVDKVEA